MVISAPFRASNSPVKQNLQAGFSTNYATSYVCYTTNTLDTIEAFIAETYVQLAAT